MISLLSTIAEVELSGTCSFVGVDEPREVSPTLLLVDARPRPRCNQSQRYAAFGWAIDIALLSSSVLRRSLEVRIAPRTRLQHASNKPRGRAWAAPGARLRTLQALSIELEIIVAYREYSRFLSINHWKL